MTTLHLSGINSKGDIFNTYKAAGVLPYAKKDNKVYFLLGGEDRSSKKKNKELDVWLYFGGKRECGEKDPHATALREFCEETCGVLDKDMIAQKLQKSPPTIWHSGGKFVLFFVEIDYDHSLPEKFRETLEKIDEEQKQQCDQFDIEWIDFLKINDCLNHRDRIVKDPSSRYGSILLANFFVQILNHTALKFVKSLSYIDIPVGKKRMPIDKVQHQCIDQKVNKKTLASHGKKKKRKRKMNQDESSQQIQNKDLVVKEALATSEENKKESSSADTKEKNEPHQSQVHVVKEETLLPQEKNENKIMKSQQQDQVMVEVKQASSDHPKKKSNPFITDIMKSFSDQKKEIKDSNQVVQQKNKEPQIQKNKRKREKESLNQDKSSQQDQVKDNHLAEEQTRSTKEKAVKIKKEKKKKKKKIEKDSEMAKNLKKFEKEESGQEIKEQQIER
eukprot:TRINITY_DN1783_c1_g1_i1.p1 TRINITY_DN1783_c1_g1~~TRINITY_DN1783_c1_g1_i1.p1  ORF type:complete len:446 (-),score=126.08 TRINITY_DN1783_c1_g1_i1:172-1509(-)